MATVLAQHTEWVRLGSLNQRTDINHRRHRNDKRIEEYIRMMENGENPPPIKVHKRTRAILDGQHRFLAAKFLSIRCDGEKAWKDAQIEVEWVGEEYPDPDHDPLMFEVATAEANRLNGEPLDENDVAGLLIRVIKEKGKEEAKKCAPRLNQTAAYVENLYRKLYPAPLPMEWGGRKLNGPPGTPATVIHGEMPPRPAQSPAAVQADLPRPTNLNDHRQARRSLVDDFRRLREKLAEVKDGLTDAEISEGEQLDHELRLKLNK